MRASERNEPVRGVAADGNRAILFSRSDSLDTRSHGQRLYVHRRGLTEVPACRQLHCHAPAADNVDLHYRVPIVGPRLGVDGRHDSFNGDGAAGF